MKKSVPFLLLSAIINFVACAEPVVVESFDISKVWSGHRVGFYLLTKNGYQYASYYDRDRNLTVAMRKLDEKKWIFQKLPTKIGWDSHNYMVMAMDKTGRLHLSGNMHCVPLIYFRTEKPYDITTFRQVKSMVGTEEKRCTYPEFMEGPSGRLIFHYRDGGSGNGNEIYNIYDENTCTWSRLLDKPLTDGNGLMNAYHIGPHKGPDGMYHMTWVWRDTPDCSTNHDLSYARSRDLIHWETIGGKTLNLPITLQTEGVVVDPVPAKGGILNGCGRFGFDSQNRVVMTYYKFDKDGNNQAYITRYEDNNWKIVQVSDWDYRWYFQGGGSIVSEIGIGGPRQGKAGTLEFSYRHKKYGSGIFVLDEKTLKPIKTYKPKSPWPAEIRKLRGDFPGMQLRLMDTDGDSGKYRYALRWETLGSNRDRPRTGPLPEPSLLQLYVIEDK